MRRQYRRYRRKNQYDSPLLILLVDTLLSLGKTLFLLTALVTIWLVGQRVIASSADTESTEPMMVSMASQASSPSMGLVSPSKTVATEKPDTNKNTLLTESWVMEQDNNHFTIQFGTSPEVELLKEFVPVIDNGGAISLFPFKKTPSGRLVYGIATGIYDDLDTALAAVEKLPKEAVEFGPWIRPIKELKTQIQRTVPKKKQDRA